MKSVPPGCIGHSFVLLLLLMTFGQNIRSQSCLTPDVYPYKHFPSGSTVYYSFDSSVPNGPEKNQIIAAIQEWSTYTDANCPDVRFVPGAYVPGPTFPPNTAYLEIRFGPIPDDGAARPEEDVTSGSNILAGSLIFNNLLTFPTRRGNVLFYDPNVGGYSDVYTKQARHEIGHLLGLSHYTNSAQACSGQIYGSAVMNDACGVNDNGTYLTNNIYYPGNNQPTALQACDKAQLSAVYCPTYSRNGSVGGSWPVTVGSYQQTETHYMVVSNYNATTGTFQLRFTDYVETVPPPPTNVSYSSSSPPTHVVVNNSDSCLNTDGSVKNWTQASVFVPPTFNCSFARFATLTYVGTENITFPVGSYPFIRVYNGQTKPGLGVPYMHLIGYSPYNNTYSYARN